MMNLNPSIINLESLLSFSARLNETTDEYFILNSAILSLMGKLKILRGCIIVPDEDKNYKVVLTKGRFTTAKAQEIVDSLADRLSTLEEIQRILTDCGLCFFLPVNYQHNNLAVLCLGNKVDGPDLSEEELQYSGLICTISANAIQNAHNHKSLALEKINVEHRHQLLNTLFEMNRDFSTLLSREQILKLLSFHLMGQLMVSRFAVYQFHENEPPELILNRFTETPSAELLSSLRATRKTSKVVISGSDPGFLDKIEAKVISPMYIQGKIKGILIVGKKMNGEDFTEENLQFIEALGSISIAALENERLFREEVEKKRIETELNLALEIQQNLLPKELPVIPGFQLAGRSLPSRYVGGDYYDFIKLPDGRLMIAIGDVSGKGMPAALLMANVQAALRLLAPLMLPLLEVILKVNSVIYQNTASDKFITLFCGILDPATGTLNYINAGHNPPLLYKAGGELIPLKTGGLIIGYTDEDLGYFMGDELMQPRDVLLLYTDGVTESLDHMDNQYGEEHLIEMLMNNSNLSSNDLVDRIFSDVGEFSKTSGQFDDITLAVIKAQ